MSLLSTSQPCCAQRQYFAPCSYPLAGVWCYLLHQGWHEWDPIYVWISGWRCGFDNSLIDWDKVSGTDCPPVLITVADIALCNWFASATVALHLYQLNFKAIKVSANGLFQLFISWRQTAKLLKRHSSITLLQCITTIHNHRGHHPFLMRPGLINFPKINNRIALHPAWCHREWIFSFLVPHSSLTNCNLP